MARRFDRSDISISLFPFLDALSGVIGILALIIASLVAMNIDNATQVFEVVSDYRGKTPRYVECDSSGVTVYPNGEKISLNALRDGSESWNRLVGQLRSSQSKYLVLLVRPNGIDSFRAAKRKPDQYKRSDMGFSYGYQALSDSGAIEVRQSK